MISLLSRTSLASVCDGLTMPTLPPMGFDPLITQHAAHQFTLSNGSQPTMIPPVMAHGTHPLLMTHGTHPMMSYGAQALINTSGQMQANSAMRAAVYKFSESLRRQNHGQNDARLPGHRSSTPIGEMSPIPQVRPLDHLQMTHDHDQLHSGHRQSNQGRGWFRVNPAGSLPPPNPTTEGFKVPG